MKKRQNTNNSGISSVLQRHRSQERIGWSTAQQYSGRRSAGGSGLPRGNSSWETLPGIDVDSTDCGYLGGTLSIASTLNDRHRTTKNGTKQWTEVSSKRFSDLSYLSSCQTPFLSNPWDRWDGWFAKAHLELLWKLRWDTSSSKARTFQR